MDMEGNVVIISINMDNKKKIVPGSDKGIISRQIITFIFLTSLIAAGMIYFVFQETDSFKREINLKLQNYLQTVSRTGSVFVENVFKDINEDMETLSSNPTIIKKLTRRGGALPPEVYFPVRDFLRQVSDTIDSFYLINVKGKVVEKYPVEENTSAVDYSDKPCVKEILYDFRERMPEKNFYNSPGMFKTDSGKYAVAICKPVKDKEKLVGVVRINYYIDSIKKHIEEIKPGDVGYVWLIDQSGIVLIHPNRKYAGKNIEELMKREEPGFNFSEFSHIVQMMKDRKSSTGIYHLPGRSLDFPLKRLVAFSPVKFGSNFWSLAVTYDFDEISDPANRHFFEIFVVTTSFLIFIVLSGILFYSEKNK